MIMSCYDYYLSQNVNQKVNLETVRKFYIFIAFSIWAWQINMAWRGVGGDVRGGEGVCDK